MSFDLLVWVGFGLFIVTLLALDLFVFHKDAQEVSTREALTWVGIWVSLGLLFGGFVWWWRSAEVAGEYIAGYLIELSLSVDNMFVFALIFSFFAVPRVFQYRLLFWGVVGAVVFRAIFIAIGAELLEHFHWALYIFGAFLIVTGIARDPIEWRDRARQKPGASPYAPFRTHDLQNARSEILRSRC